MRILASFLSPFTTSSKVEIWGGERAFIELMKHLMDKASLDIIERKPNVSKSFLKGKSVKVFEIEANSRIEWMLKAILLGLKWRRRGSHYDIIYAYNHSFTNTLVVFVLSKIMKKSFVINVFHVEKHQAKSFKKGFEIARGLYGYNVKEALVLSLEWAIINAILKRAALITVPSEATSTDLKSLGIPQSKIRLVYLGIEHENSERLLQGERKDFDCIYVGRLTLNKGFFDILLAWKEVVKELPNAKLAIVDSEIPKAAKDLIEKNNLSGNIFFFGHLSRKELSEVLSTSRVLVMPSHTEGFCFIVGKAILHHVPVVAYDTLVLREVYGFLKNVKFVKEWDVKALAQQIINTLSEKFSKAEMAEDCRILLQRYSWNHMANETYNVFAQFTSMNRSELE